jgi:ABC-2 type transport system ATP-binding protein
MSDPVLRFDSVRRTFGDRIALEALDLQLAPGEVLGLLGRNGAGKTTTLRLAIGVLHPDRGRIRAMGLDPVRRGVSVRERAALLSEEAALYPWMTVAEILWLGARLHPRWDAARAAALVERLGLDPAARIRTLSRGTKAKLALVLAVSPRPDLLLLDDPTAGLDPVVRREVLEGLLDAIPEEGGAIVYASHLVHDVERVADRIAVLDEGRKVLDEPLEALRASVRRLTAIFEDSPPPHLEIPGSLRLRTDGRVLTCVARSSDTQLHTAATQLGAHHVEVAPIDLEEILVAALGSEERSGRPLGAPAQAEAPASAVESPR